MVCATCAKLLSEQEGNEEEGKSPTWGNQVLHLPTSRQQEALTQWQSWIQQAEHFYQHGDHGVPDEASMERLINIMSELFFLGKLNLVRFKWNPKMHAEKGLYGQCNRSERYSRAWCRITMDPGDHHVELGDDSRLSSTLGTLLHECVHAFFRIYARTFTGRLYGKTGHGDAWYMAAYHVQAAARAHLRKGISLGVWDELVSEYAEGGCLPRKLVNSNERVSAQEISRFRKAASALDKHMEHGLRWLEGYLAKDPNTTHRLPKLCPFADAELQFGFRLSAETRACLLEQGKISYLSGPEFFRELPA